MLVSLSMLVVIACAKGEAGDQGAAEGAYTGRVLPVEAAIEEVLGYSESEILRAVDLARYEAIVDCMVAQGWDFSLNDLPSVEEPNVSAGPRSSLTGDVAEYFLNLLEVLAAPEPLPSEPGSPEYSEDEAKCWSTAIAQFPDPLASLASWLTIEAGDLNARVTQDARVIKAAEDAMACVANQGFERGGMEQASNRFQAEASAIFDHYREGDLSYQDAQEQLLVVAANERAYNQSARACFEAQATTERLVRAEYEAEWLRSNGDRLALAVDEARSAVDRYGEFLNIVSPEQ